ncbi:hypothetical protein ZWY2020_011208 [Hordeum vulgare]|nr:hypothetical protein ZWY2020_011208 [Hordeum vulgare]
MAVGASFTLPDGDKRSSMDGHSESGVAMDSISDEQISISNPGSDEIKNKYNELHRRFYELAEHNNMLEQSLVEGTVLYRNGKKSLIRLLEVEHERDTLHSKIEHLEDSSEMLITDLEESHKRISELSAEVVAIKAEKDSFSESLDKLRFEFLGLSEKAVQDEFIRDNLRKDLDELQRKYSYSTCSLEFTVNDTDGTQILHHLAIACHAVSDCVKDCNDLKWNINRFTSQNNELESLRENILELQSEIKEKEEESSSLRRNLSVELEDARMQVHNLEEHVEMLLNEKKALETQASELKDLETVATHGFKSLAMSAHCSKVHSTYIRQNRWDVGIW